MSIKESFVVIFVFAASVAWSRPSNTHNLELIGLQFKDSIFEGEVVNRGNETVKEVWIHVAFKDSKGNTALEQDFRVVPGGDGSSIPKGWSKHFRYQLNLGGSAELTPVGSIKSVEME